MEEKKPIYLKLFLSSFSLSAFTFGGGYVIVSLMKKRYVDKLKWIDEKEMLNLIALAQSAPGPVAVNAAVLLGRRVAGWRGSFIALFGTVLPPLITLSAVSLFYSFFQSNTVVKAVFKGMQAGVTAVIADVTVDLTKNVCKEKDLFSILIMIFSFLLVFFLNLNVAVVIIICAVIGAVRRWLWDKKMKSGGVS